MLWNLGFAAFFFMELFLLYVSIFYAEPRHKMISTPIRAMALGFPKKFLSYKFCDQANLFKFYVILIEEVSSHEAKE